MNCTLEEIYVRIVVKVKKKKKHFLTMNLGLGIIYMNII